MGNSNSRKKESNKQCRNKNVKKPSLNKPDKNANNKPNDKPPDYEQIMIQYDNNDKKNDNNSKGKLKYTFRALVIANKNYQRDNSSYVDSLIALKNQNITDVVPAHDPYILKWANDSYNRLKYKYNNSELNTKGINSNILFNIDLCKKYIKYYVNGNYLEDYYHCVKNIMSHDNSFIKELLPEYHNILKIWKSIITINRIYMEAWESNGELRKIFGYNCEPFNLEIAIIDKGTSTINAIRNLNLFNDIRNIYSFINSYHKNIIRITRNYDNLPSEAVLNDVAKKMNILGTKYDTELIFYINPNDIKEYVQKREIIYSSISIC